MGLSSERRLRSRTNGALGGLTYPSRSAQGCHYLSHGAWCPEMCRNRLTHCKDAVMNHPWDANQQGPR